MIKRLYHSHVNYVYIEAEKQEQINKANGESAAMVAVAEARAKGLQMVAKALGVQVSKW